MRRIEIVYYDREQVNYIGIKLIYWGDNFLCVNFYEIRISDYQ